MTWTTPGEGGAFPATARDPAEGGAFPATARGPAEGAAAFAAACATAAGIAGDVLVPAAADDHAVHRDLGFTPALDRVVLTRSAPVK